ncbi:MAG: long-chain fatty acid transport protein [Cocleimonas sp.]|jgi:long-chain fatty acid transport protein
MKNTIKIATAVSAVLVSSTAFGVAGLDRLVFSPSFLFEEGNYAELTFARADPTVRTTFAPSANIADEVDTLKFAYKHQINDKFGIGFMANTQPVGVDVNYNVIGSALRGSISAKSYIALGHYKATEKISAFGGLNYQRRKANADLTPNGAPGNTFIATDSDTGFIVGAAYSIPKIALRASLTFESDLEFSHKTTNSNPAVNNGFSLGGNTTSGSPEALTLELQSGIAENTLLFGSVRRSKWSDSQVSLLGTRQLSNFDDTTVYKLGVGRKFSDSFSASVTLNYEPSNGLPSSPFSPQDGERGIALGGKFTSKDGLMTSIGIQYRELGDTVTTASSGSLPFKDNHVVTVGVKFAKSFK